MLFNESMAYGYKVFVYYSFKYIRFTVYVAKNINAEWNIFIFFTFKFNIDISKLLFFLSISLPFFTSSKRKCIPTFDF